MKFSSFLILFLISIFTYSQEELKFVLFGGPDFSLLDAPAEDSTTVKPLVSPLFGAELRYPITSNSNLDFGTSYFLKSSIDIHYIKYHNHFASVYANYYYSITKGFGISFGPQYSILLKAQSVHGVNKTSLTGYQSYTSVNVGVNFRLQNHLNMGVIYEYPIDNPKLASWPSIRIKLSLIIDNDLMGIDRKKQKYKSSQIKYRKLKKSALLVRLRGYQKQINVFAERGDTSMVRLMMQKRVTLNRSIMNAFASEFDFCPVYFFYNYDTKKIKSKDFKSVFINKNLAIDSTILFDLDTFLIGELGYNLIGDTSQIFGSGDVYKNGFNSADGYARASTTDSDISHYGFYIRDQDFSYIDRPFPNFISGKFLFFKISHTAIIRKLNDRLKNFK